MHGLACIAAYANPLPISVKLVLFLIVFLHFYWTFYCYSVAPEYQGITLDIEEGTWEVVGPSGIVSATLQTSTVVTQWFVSLHLKAEGKRLAILIFRDATDPDSFRRLRVYLRIRGNRRPHLSRRADPLDTLPW